MIPSSGVSLGAGDPRPGYERKLIRGPLGVVIGVGLLKKGAVTHRVYSGGGRRGDRAAVPGVGGGQLAAVHGQPTVRAFQGGDQDGGGREERGGAPGGPRRWRAWKSAGVAAKRVTAGGPGGPGAVGPGVDRERAAPEGADAALQKAALRPLEAVRQLLRARRSPSAGHVSHPASSRSHRSSQAHASARARARPARGASGSHTTARACRRATTGSDTRTRRSPLPRQP